MNCLVLQFTNEEKEIVFKTAGAIRNVFFITEEIEKYICMVEDVVKPALNSLIVRAARRKLFGREISEQLKKKVKGW